MSGILRMAMKILRLTAIAAAIASVPVAAQPPAAQPKWSVDWADDNCALTQAPATAGDTVLRIVRTPGDGLTLVTLANPGWRRSPAKHPEKVTLSLEPGGQVDAAGDFVREGQVGSLLLLTVADERFLTALSGAQRLAVGEAGSPIADFALPAAPKAIAALRACEEDGMARWSIDRAAWHALRSHPVALFAPRDIVRPNDFPDEAMTSGASGKVVVRLAVDPRGKATDCTAVVKSGYRSLDEQTCSLYLSRARFKPALDGEGRPTAGIFVAIQTWRN
jgi:TonB family protein